MITNNLKKGILKRLTVLFLVAVSIIGIINMTGCSAVENKGTHGDKFTVVTSFYPMYVFTKNVIGDIPRVELINMTQPQTGCLHDYQLIPADLKTLEKADTFVINGAGMEGFMDKVIKQRPDLNIIEAAKGMELLKDDSGEENPHVWVSISGAITEVKNIAEGLAAADSKNAASYRQNADKYVRLLEQQRDKMHQKLDNFNNKNIVTFHEAFPYFAKEFGMNIVAVVEREPGTEPSAGELAVLIDRIKGTKVKVLFAEPQYSKKAAESIAKETGARVYMLDPVVTGEKDAPADAYLKAMDQNLKVLEEAFSSK